MNRFLSLALLLIAAVIYIACTNDKSCHENRYVAMTSDFYTVKNDSTKVFTIDSIWVKGLGNDSVLYANTKSVTTISLPLHKLQDTSRFVIRFNNIYDTLTIVHANIQKYLSLECGCLVTHNIDSVNSYSTTHKVKRIKVKYNYVSTTARENLQIYF
ncbi:MAG: hypothetical protein H6Q17_1391 [Bacteroidetes bacterium]|jgi:hypothetical protein|nr:hypothetical protein [Bacteroidota bacterium]